MATATSPTYRWRADHRARWWDRAARTARSGRTGRTTIRSPDCPRSHKRHGGKWSWWGASAGPRRLAPPSYWLRSCLKPHAGIDHAVEHVDHEIERHIEDRHGQHETLHRREIRLQQRFHRIGADAR